MDKVEKLLANLDVDGLEHTYIVSCLQMAVDYCKQQYEESGGEIDPLLSADYVGLDDEADKFKLLDSFLKTL